MSNSADELASSKMIVSAQLDDDDRDLIMTVLGSCDTKKDPVLAVKSGPLVSEWVGG